MTKTIKTAQTKFGLHYTPVQLAKDWGFSPDFIRDLFRNEPDVIIIERPEKMHKRGYTSMRIPAHVAECMYVRLTTRHRNKSAAALSLS